MEVTHAFVTVGAFDGTGEPPHEVIAKNAADRWLVASSAIEPSKPIRWSPVVKAEHVFIPLVPYLMPSDPAAAMAYMLQLGMHVSFSVGHPIRRLHLSIGVPVHEVLHEGDNVWQFQVGFGIVIR